MIMLLPINRGLVSGSQTSYQGHQHHITGIWCSHPPTQAGAQRKKHVCFPRVAPYACSTFHRFLKSSETVCHSWGFLGHWTSSFLYSFRIALQTSGTNIDIVLCDTCYSYRRVGYLSPVTENLRVTASFRPDSKRALQLVFCFAILGPTLWRSSPNIAGPFIFIRSSCISWGSGM